MVKEIIKHLFFGFKKAKNKAFYMINI